MHYRSPGSGHLYQGRYKSFPVQSDEHFLTVARYIHANPLRAGLVKRAQDWPWSDLGRRPEMPPPAPWPVDRPDNWLKLVNQPQPEAQVAAVETSLRRGRPFGSPRWVGKTAAKLNLNSSLRPRGRPPKPLKDLSPRYRRQRQRKETDKSG